MRRVILLLSTKIKVKESIWVCVSTRYVYVALMWEITVKRNYQCGPIFVQLM